MLGSSILGLVVVLGRLIVCYFCNKGMAPPVNLIQSTPAITVPKSCAHQTVRKHNPKK